jgi:hypothetical protein
LALRRVLVFVSSGSLNQEYQNMKYSIGLRAVVIGCCVAGLGSAAKADYAAAVMALSPSHYYRLNETVEGMAEDSAGNIDGTHQGIIFEGFGEVGAAGPPVPGLEPTNVAFGANNTASIGLGDGTNFAASTMTISAWFTENGSEGGDRLWTNNQTDPNNSFQIFFGGGFGDVAASIGIGLNPAVNGFPASGLPSGSGVGNFHIPDSTVPVKDGQWHHIVASRNGNNIENVIVVIDGVNYDVTTWRDSTDTWGTTGSDAQIATRTPPDGGAAMQALNGTVDEVAIWLNRQLTVAESIALYQAAVNPSEPVVGDYNGDGTVNAPDYAVWRDGGSPDDTIAGYNLWKSRFGATSGGGAAVPEPSTLVLILLGLVAACGAARRR